jgi:spermidine/putrescine transport system permease protein
MDHGARTVNGRLRTITMLAPAMSVLIGLFLLPVGYFLMQSFWRIRFFMLDRALTFHNYQVIGREYGASWVFTLAIAALIAILTTTGAFVLSYYARFRAGRYEALVLFLTLMTLFGGYLVKVYAWKTILGIDGILNSTLLTLGIINQPISQMLYTPFAVVVTLVNFLLHFAVLPIYAAFRSFDDRTLESARDLGAAPLRACRDILIPQTANGITAGFSLCFLLAAGDYVTPQLVGGPESVMVGNFIESQFVDRLDAPLGAALSFTVLASCLLILALSKFAIGRIGRQP